MRVLTTFVSLNLVVLRIGHAYGPYTNFGVSKLTFFVPKVFRNNAA